MNIDWIKMHFLRLLSATVCCGFLVGFPAVAATIEARSDLQPYLETLQQTYIPNAPLDPTQPVFGSVHPTAPHIITLSGVIEKGDVDKLSEAMQGKGGLQIVFNSPGGNFLEGIKIGAMLQDNLSSSDPSLFGVYVLKGQECLSACALAFSLAASNRSLVEEGTDSRYIEDGATLGFHMGTLSKEQAAQSGNVKSIMDLTYSVVAAYAKLIKGNVNPPILLEEALKHREADSFFYLKGGQRSLSMGFTPVTRSVLAAPLYSYAMDMGTIDAMCRTLIMSTRLPKTLVTYNYLFINGDGPSGSEIGLGELAELRRSRTLAGSMASGETCYITLRDNETILIRITDSGQSRSCFTKDANGFNNEAWCASGRDGEGMMTIGLLADTLFCNAGKLQTSFMSWESDVSNQYGTETFKDSEMWDRPITRDVNVRQAPSLKAGIVAGLVAGEQIQVTDCQLVDDSQGVWFQIESQSGNGWISARFASRQSSEMRAQTSP